MKKLWNKFVQSCYAWARAAGIICILMMVGCDRDFEQNGIKIYRGVLPNNIKEIVVDGCTYLCIGQYPDGSGGISITHKGNCKNHHPDTVYIPVPSESHSQIK